MPGLYRSPGMADIDVCYGKRQAGTEALKRTSRRYENENAALEELMQRPRRAVTLPISGADGHDEEDDAHDIWCEEGSRPQEESRDVEVSDGSLHEGFGDRRPEEETGLPPTPPEALSSDEPQQEPQPMFADGVRNALSSQKSGALSTTPVNPQLSPPTPDTTPPARPRSGTAVTRRQRSLEASPIEPVLDERQNLQAPPRPHPDFHAESYQTAREELPVCDNEGDGQVILPEHDRLPDHWLDDTQNKPDLSGAEDKAVETDEQAVANAVDDMNRTISPTPPRTRYRFESPQVEREMDWEKHISYVSGPEELDLGEANEGPPEMQEVNNGALTGLGVSGVEMEEKHRSAEDMNNSVYKQIQQENIRRESAISTNSGAIRAGIVLPSAESTPKSVRRRKKCGSLRDGPASEGKRHSDENTEHVLKHERRHLPTRRELQESPVLVRKRGQEEPSRSTPNDVRQVSSPARLGEDASKRATLTLARKVGRDERDAPDNHSRKLKRQSHGERLSKNMDVRRTSLEVSPSDLEEAFDRIDRGAASVRKQKTPSQQRARMDTFQSTDARAPPVEQQQQMNKGVKRSKPPNLDGPYDVVLHKAIPSVSSEPEVPASPRQVRRFSREERLENNEQLRRFSAPQSQDQQTSAGQSSDLDRQFSSESATKRGSLEPSVLSSPRKSMDARFLHPTTTPMSVSAFSDRTENIEVCEASGVRIYPHNNNSLLVVQQGSRPASKDTKTPEGQNLADVNPNAEPIFAAQIDPPTPVLGNSNPSAHVDSPLTNPRAAPAPPEPPSFQFIPPTPNEELERQLSDGYTGDGTLTGQVNLPGRNLSFKQKVRRYSDSFFSRSSSFRRNAPTRPRELPARDTHLSPMWRPQRFWDDSNSDSDDDYYDDDYEPGADVLPPGGDTSNFDDEEPGKKRPFFPRAMSKRLPGFRGKGGFLQGNSLGIERHGSNNRRHYVSSAGPRTLSHRASDEVLHTMHSSPGMTNVTPPLPRSISHESLRQIAKRTNSFKVPFTGGMRARWVGTTALRMKIREARLARQEREAEKRRERLKGRIGMRVYHG